MDMIGSDCITPLKNDDTELTATALTNTPKDREDETSPQVVLQPRENQMKIPVSLYVKYLLDLDANFVTIDDKSTIGIQMNDKSRVYNDAKRTSLAVSVLTDNNLPEKVKYDVLSQRRSLLSLIRAVRTETDHRALNRLLHQVVNIQTLVAENMHKVESAVNDTLASYLTHLLVQLIAVKIYLKKRIFWLFGARKGAAYQSRIWLKKQWQAIFRRCFLDECAAELCARDDVTSSTDATTKMVSPEPSEKEDTVLTSDDELEDIIKLVPEGDFSSCVLDPELTPSEWLTSQEHTSTYATQDAAVTTSADGSKTEDGIKCFTLPITFFNNSKNIKLLSKCKPLCIKLVDYKKHSWYFNKRQCLSSIAKALYPKTNAFDIGKVWQSNLFENITEMSLDSLKKNVNVRNQFYNTLNMNISNVSESNKLQETKQNTVQEKVTCNEDIDFKANKGLIGLKIVKLSERPENIMLIEDEPFEIIDLGKEVDSVITNNTPYNESELMKHGMPKINTPSSCKSKKNKETVKCSLPIEKVMSGLGSKIELNGKKIPNIKSTLKIHSDIAPFFSQRLNKEIISSKLKPINEFSIDMPFENEDSNTIKLTYCTPKKQSIKSTSKKFILNKNNIKNKNKGNCKGIVRNQETQENVATKRSENNLETHKKRHDKKNIGSFKCDTVAKETRKTRDIDQNSDKILKTLLKLPAKTIILHDNTESHTEISPNAYIPTKKNNNEISELNMHPNISSNFEKSCELKVQVSTVSQINERINHGGALEKQWLLKNPSWPPYKRLIKAMEVEDIKTTIKEKPKNEENRKVIATDTCNTIKRPVDASQVIPPTSNNIILANSTAQRVYDKVSPVNCNPNTNVSYMNSAVSNVTAETYKRLPSMGPFYGTNNPALGTQNINREKLLCESIPPNTHSSVLRQWRRFNANSSPQHLNSGICGSNTNSVNVPQIKWPYQHYNYLYSQMLWEQRVHEPNRRYQNYSSTYHPGFLSSPTMLHHALPPLSNLLHPPPPPPPPPTPAPIAPAAPPPPPPPVSVSPSVINHHVRPNTDNVSILSVPGQKHSVIKNYALVTPQKKSSKNTGYSPPILPIPTLEKSLEILTLVNSIDKPVITLGKNDLRKNSSKSTSAPFFPPKRVTDVVDEMSNDALGNKRKITLQEYKNRGTKKNRKSIDLTLDAADCEQKKPVYSGIIHEPKRPAKRSLARKHNTVSNDQGYDSDMTIKLDD